MKTTRRIRELQAEVTGQTWDNSSQTWNYHLHTQKEIQEIIEAEAAAKA